ncbi:MAG: CdaR family protein [Jejuia sp.]
MKKLKEKLIASIKNKRLNVFLLFVLSAFVILIFSKLSKEYTNTVVFNIDKINVPEDKVVLNDSSNKLKITLKTHGFKWLTYYFNQPKLKIDFSNEVYTIRDNFIYTKSISYINEMEQFQNETKILNISPDTLRFKYDTNLVRKIPVAINTDITFAPGFDVLNNYEVTPDSITVIGPHEVVQNIEILKTEQVILNDIKSDIDTEVKLILPKNTKDLKFSAMKVNLTADVEKFTEGTLTVPVQIINTKEDISIKYFPKMLKVSFYTSLKEFASVKANDFKIVCDFEKVDTQQSFLIPELVQQPKSVKRVKLNQQHIEFIILK